jgi:hypothetical protein
VYVESGEILTNVVKDVGEAFREIREDYDEWIASINEAGNPFTGEGSGPPGPSYTGEGYTPPQNTYGNTTPPPTGDEDETAALTASGALFNTSGAHRMIVGEAGTETVAVLRNPREMMMNLGGGGAQAIQIIFNNPVVRDNSDIEKIARAVEETLRQRAMLMRPQ